jgi:hypothetical protein
MRIPGFERIIVRIKRVAQYVAQPFIISTHRLTPLTILYPEKIMQGKLAAIAKSAGVA